MPKKVTKIPQIIIEIKGRVFSKKNSRILTRRGGYITSLPSRAFERYRKDAIRQIGEQPQIKPPYEVIYLFEMKGLGSTDIDNMIAGINDILQEAGILTDDKHILKIKAEKLIGAEEYRTQAWIKTIQKDKEVARIRQHVG